MYLKVKIGNETFCSLVDTGASGLAFISESLCKRLNLSPHRLSSPIQLTGFEGKNSQKVTHMVNFSLCIGSHQEYMSAYVTNPCKNDLILGLPWLEKHNPYVDWKNNCITFGETCLEKGCCQFETTLPYFNSTTIDLKESIPKGQIARPDVVSTKPKPVSPPQSLSASEFFALSKRSDIAFFAFSLRDLDLLLDSYLKRMPTINIGQIKMMIPKDASTLR